MPYLSKKTEQDLFKLVEWSKSDQVNAIICKDPNALELFVTIESDLIRLMRRRKVDNDKTWQTIKERRKTNKNYGR